MKARGKSRPAKTVDEYIAAAPKEMRKPLGDLRRAIKSAAPKAEESIKYRMPCYKYYGWMVFFGAFKNHVSLFPASGSTVKVFKSRLKAYELSGTTIHFTSENPLSASLVKDIVRARMKENESRASNKK